MTTDAAEPSRVARETLPQFPSAPEVPRTPFPERRFQAGELEIRPLAGPAIEIPSNEDEDFLRRFDAWHARTNGSIPEYIVYEFLVFKKKQIDGVDFCPTPGHRVLTRDLRWVPVESLVPGDELVTFDDEPFAWPHRHWDCGVVEWNELRRVDQLYRIRLDDGTELTVTPDHRWLSSYSPRHGPKNWGHRWIRTDRLREGIPLLRFFTPWEEERSWEAGWLAGLLDGEGSLSMVGNARGHYSMNLALAQKPGSVTDKATGLLQEFGFSMKTYSAKTLQMHIQGGLAERLRCLGSLRPMRLIEKMGRNHWGTIRSKQRPCVVSVEPVGPGEICSLSVSTGTYVLEGFGAHNTFQHPQLGGRTEFGGFVLDFFLILRRAGWRVLGRRYHLLQAEDRARDLIVEQLLEERGIEVINLWDDDLLVRADYVLNLAWEGREVTERRPGAG